MWRISSDMKGTNQWGFAAFLGNISVSQLSTNAMFFFIILIVPDDSMERNADGKLMFPVFKRPNYFPNIVYTVAVSIIDDFFSCTFPVTLHFVYIIQSSFGVCHFLKMSFTLRYPIHRISSNISFSSKHNP